MTRFGRLAVTLVGLTYLVACGQGTEPSAPATSQSVVFENGTWTLTVDRAVPAGSFGVNAPDDPIADSAYAPTAGGAVYSLDVSDSGRRVVVTAQPPMVGSLSESTSQRLLYRLVEGTFAGGRLVVWTTANGLQGEVTIFGSGVSVIRSERGSLRRRE